MRKLFDRIIIHLYSKYILIPALNRIMQAGDSQIPEGEYEIEVALVPTDEAIAAMTLRGDEIIH